MSRFHGRHRKGAMKTVKLLKHGEAELRNLMTIPQRRSMRQKKAI
jgi:hypothetical protein